MAYKNFFNCENGIYDTGACFPRKQFFVPGTTVKWNAGGIQGWYGAALAGLGPSTQSIFGDRGYASAYNYYGLKFSLTNQQLQQLATWYPFVSRKDYHSNDSDTSWFVQQWSQLWQQIMNNVVIQTKNQIQDLIHSYDQQENTVVSQANALEQAGQYKQAASYWTFAAGIADKITKVVDGWKEHPWIHASNQWDSNSGNGSSKMRSSTYKELAKSAKKKGAIKVQTNFTPQGGYTQGNGFVMTYQGPRRSIF